MAFDPLSAFLGAAAPAAIGVIGYFARRYLFGEREREKVSLTSSYANLLATLKNNGLTIEEVENIRSTMTLRKQKTDTLENSNRQVIGIYWTQAAMNVRAAGAANVAEAQLQSAISELEIMINEQEKAALYEAQLAWDAFRDAHVTFATLEVEGRSIAPTISASEHEIITSQRVATIKAIIDRRKNLA